MSTQRTGVRIGSSIRRPANPAGYVAIVLAAITGAVHLLLAPAVLEFDQTLSVLFALNGLGFVSGIFLYLSPYWRRELFLVAALYALVTIGAFFAWGGWEGLSAFYMRGELNTMAVVAKGAEALLAVSALYLYAATES